MVLPSPPAPTLLLLLLSVLSPVLRWLLLLLLLLLSVPPLVLQLLLPEATVSTDVGLGSLWLLPSLLLRLLRLLLSLSLVEKVLLGLL
jgi:hypothetical protein